MLFRSLSVLVIQVWRYAHFNFTKCVSIHFPKAMCLHSSHFRCDIYSIGPKPRLMHSMPFSVLDSFIRMDSFNSTHIQRSIKSNLTNALNSTSMDQLHSLLHH